MKSTEVEFLKSSGLESGPILTQTNSLSKLARFVAAVIKAP